MPMLARLRPRSDTVYVSQNRTVLATGLDGFIAEGSAHGLFVHETRLLSRYRYLIDGAPFLPVALSNVEPHTWLGYYITVPPGSDTGMADMGSGQISAASQQTLELRLSRYVGAGIHEDVDLTNFTQAPTSFALTLDVDADFADQVEVAGERRQHGDLTRVWRGDLRELTFDYRAEHRFAHQGECGSASIHRAITVRVERSTSAPSGDGGRITFAVALPAGGTWHACINFVPSIDGEAMEPAYGCGSFSGTPNAYDTSRRIFIGESTIFTAPHAQGLAPVVVGALQRATHDLAALRLHDLDHGERAWTMAAGLPIYVALFGRDVLTTAWQAALASPAMMRGTLAELARWQGLAVNDWRDEDPGRMLHEAHTGPLEALNVNPRGRYYGSITTSAFYPFVVAELWHWTGNKEQVRPLVPVALEALRWVDTYSDRDGDGFYEYQTRSKDGVTNQGWKDSGDAIVYPDGAQVRAPIAPCEEQAFVYAAKLHLSEVLWWLDDKAGAKRLYGEAGELKKRFNDRFWMEDEGFFAMGLDAEKRPIRSIGSNPGHCVAGGIVDAALVTRVADRLLAGDLFTGWGVRTLSSRHPAYNPYSYHRGSVWPVEQGTFALGFMRYGLHAHVERICRGQFEAAALFDAYRLPELFSGHQRDSDHPFPALYPQANSPQAWSASAIFFLLQSLLGLYPYAPLKTLLVDPHLPEWLPEITLENLRVGEAAVTIHFSRKANGDSTYRVTDIQGTLHVVRQPSPWSLTATFAERLVDALSSLRPSG